MRECPHCFRRVLPMPSGECPACHRDTNATRDVTRQPLVVGENSSLPELCCQCGNLTKRNVVVARSRNRGADELAAAKTPDDDWAIPLSAHLGMNIGDLFEAREEPRRGCTYASNRGAEFCGSRSVTRCAQLAVSCAHGARLTGRCRNLSLPRGNCQECPTSRANSQNNLRISSMT